MVNTLIDAAVSGLGSYVVNSSRATTTCLASYCSSVSVSCIDSGKKCDKTISSRARGDGMPGSRVGVDGMIGSGLGPGVGVLPLLLFFRTLFQKLVVLLQ